MLERAFRLRESGTTVSREIIAGITTFAAMAYILAINPAILMTTGMDQGALVTATAVSAAVMTIAMALATRYPIALAPGMGLNAYFAFSICEAKGIPWQAALGLVFYSGVLFFLLTVSGLRRKMLDAIPHEMKLAITAGIGFFIAFIGLQNGGLVVSDAATLVKLGDFSQPRPLLVFAGILLTAVLMARKTPGAIILVIIALTGAGFLLHDATGAALTRAPTDWVHWPASLAPTWLQLDLGYFWTDLATSLHLVIFLLFLNVFDNVGTLIGVAHRAGLLDRDGNLPRMDRALMADAGATMFGSLLGTSTVTSYIESTTGVEAGGRTGLTAIVTAICFLLALFLTPLILVIPAFATAPALVIVGILMMQGLGDLALEDFSLAVPVFATVFMMPLTYSISEGLAFGLLAFVGMKIGLGRRGEVSLTAAILCLLFLVSLIWGRV
ncbi:MAG TPA: NCS2 family permease [Chthoniobacteraceae bacterium]|nr:NCS2 family permease [Chthoniobacteraceae bacterium]